MFPPVVKPFTTALMHRHRLRSFLACEKEENGLEHSRTNQSRLALICGTGYSLWDDLDTLGFNWDKWDQSSRFDIISVNRAVMDLPCPVNHAYSNHMDMLPKWVAARDVSYQQKDRRYASPTHLHSNQKYSGVSHWKTLPGHGTSGLNAVYLALYLGYDRVKVCGMPIDNGPHYYDAPKAKTTNFLNQRFKEEEFMASCQKDGRLRPWVKFLREFKDVVEPMSGNPRRIYEELSA